MLVLCTGMIRSGSTWSYNVCLRLLRAAYGDTVIAAGYSESLRDLQSYATSDQTHAVLKCHALDDESRDWLRNEGRTLVPLIYTVRDPRDVIASALAIFNQSVDVWRGSALNSLQFYQWQRAVGRVSLVPYAAILDRPRQTVALIARHLRLELGSDEFAGIAESCSRDAQEQRVLAKFEEHEPAEIYDDGTFTYHRPTLLHRNHFRPADAPGWQDLLSPDDQQEMDQAFRPWRTLFAMPIAISLEPKAEAR
ncbi:MAG: hypothetical protein QOD74_3115 [Variibacter sp.]|nr:hypothetical protein [Variibacter sp.]